MPRIDWDDPKIEIALRKAMSAYLNAPYREKHHAVEKEFVKYTGVWAAFGTIRQHAKEKGIWIGGRKR